MAGNIIPAIATTNAIIAGIVVMQAIRILSGTKASAIRRTYLTYASRRPQLLLLENPAPPKPACYVCSVQRISLLIDTVRATLNDLLKCISEIRVDSDDATEKAFNECALEEGGRILYDPDFDDNCEMTLEELGLREWSMVSVTDEDSGGKVVLMLEHLYVFIRFSCCL